ncbi:hypothetical protein J3R82DRAFT_4659 [Butyriboletus roseoflavus]|nr:hypothetical protein J3R82DRAFT_4659 [Butyriboletus roseoflavus]
MKLALEGAKLWVLTRSHVACFGYHVGVFLWQCYMIDFQIGSALVREKADPSQLQWMSSLSFPSPPLTMTGAYTLLQFGNDPFSHHFEDLESRPAFTVSTNTPTSSFKSPERRNGVNNTPTSWARTTPTSISARTRARGFLVYGNGKEVPMAHQIRQKKDGSTSRYFTTPHGKELKWKIFPQKMECVDGRTTVATWELSQPEDVFNARITIKHAGLSVVTEILTTLTLNRMAMALSWQT